MEHEAERSGKVTVFIVFFVRKARHLECRIALGLVSTNDSGGFWGKGFLPYCLVHVDLEQREFWIGV